MCLFKTFWVTLSYSKSTHITYIIWKYIKKLIKLFFYNVFLYIKMSNNYQKYKEQLQKEAHQNISEEEKSKRWKKAWEKYQN